MINNNELNTDYNYYLNMRDSMIDNNGFNTDYNYYLNMKDSDKENLIALSNINNEEASIKKATDLEIHPGILKNGQGEYVVFHKLPNGEIKNLSLESYEIIYSILIQNSPFELFNKNLNQSELINRNELINKKIKAIDPTLNAVFIPRTLYELIFIRKCILEDIKNNEICPDLKPSNHSKTLRSFRNNNNAYQQFLADQKTRRELRKCWHLCNFTDVGDNEHSGVKKVAFRLNKNFIKLINNHNSHDGFIYENLQFLINKEISFLQNHYQNNLELMEKKKKGMAVEILCRCDDPGPTVNFGFESDRGQIMSMGIRDQKDAQIIRNALALDCSILAEQHFILYRGANYERDNPSVENKDIPYSLSYGSSLFAGCLYDGDAAPFYFMRANKNGGYAIAVPFDQLNDSPFYIPPAHTVTQLFGRGELFHARTKAWNGADLNEINGIRITDHLWTKRDHLQSNLSKEELINQFETYKNNAILLK